MFLSKFYLRVWQRFWLLTIPLTLLAAGAYISASILQHNMEQSKQQSKVYSALDIGVSLARHDLETVMGHLNFLANSQSLNAFTRQDGPEIRAEIEQMYFNLSNTSRLYDQIRLLGPDGMELVRVDLRDGKAVPVRGDKLQNKAGRYYFTEAAAITNHQIYVSPLDLNIERGEIELPYKPMIRFARPVRDDKGALKGVVVLNYLGALFLDKLRSELGNVPGHGALLNKDGYWLVSEEPGQEWGFMLPHKQSFRMNYPAAWQKIRYMQEGTIIENGGKFSFRNVYPMSGLGTQIANADHFMEQWKIVVVNIQWNYNWQMLLSSLPVLYPIFFIYPVGLVLIFVWARASVGRRSAERKLKTLNRSLEHKVAERTRELEATKNVTIVSMASLAETRDNETGQHIHRTQLYVKRLAEELSYYPDYQEYLTPEVIAMMYKSAPLHDIGKVGIPDHILLKPGRLTEEEFEVMKTHTRLGADALDHAITILKAEVGRSESACFLSFAKDIARHHHERWDGSGYPDGLHGHNIPLAARIMAVADVFDALSNRRVYKQAFDRRKTEQIIIDGSGTQFEPMIIEAFVRLKEEFWEIRARFSEEEQEVKERQGEAKVAPLTALR